jgi:hypothetical protein
MPCPVNCSLEVYYTLSGLRRPYYSHIIDVSTTELTQFNFWVQYAAAAYYLDVYKAQVGAKILCSKGNCPLVEQADSTVFYDFSE